MIKELEHRIGLSLIQKYNDSNQELYKEFEFNASISEINNCIFKVYITALASQIMKQENNTIDLALTQADKIYMELRRILIGECEREKENHNFREMLLNDIKMSGNELPEVLREFLCKK